jgi:hypothetical protein
MTDFTPTADDARTRLALYPLTFVDEGDQVVIGRTDTDSFAVFPPHAAAALLYQRGRCHAALGMRAAARDDLTAHLALGDSPYEKEVHELLSA